MSKKGHVYSAIWNILVPRAHDSSGLWQESIPATGQKDRGLWGRECIWNRIFSCFFQLVFHAAFPCIWLKETQILRLLTGQILNAVLGTAWIQSQPANTAMVLLLVTG